MDELVERLSSGEHPVSAGGPHASLDDLRRRLDELKYMLIKFTDTRGGTELGMDLDEEATDASAADFEQGQGTLHIEGSLVLNYDPVRCVADIDLATLEGTGHLVPLEEPATAS